MTCLDNGGNSSINVNSIEAALDLIPGNICRLAEVRLEVESQQSALRWTSIGSQFPVEVKIPIKVCLFQLLQELTDLIIPTDKVVRFYFFVLWKRSAQDFLLWPQVATHFKVEARTFSLFPHYLTLNISRMQKCLLKHHAIQMLVFTSV